MNARQGNYKHCKVCRYLNAKYLQENKLNPCRAGQGRMKGVNEKTAAYDEIGCFNYGDYQHGKQTKLKMEGL